jgi:hypothetical protein
VAYVVDPGEYAGLRLALWALVADGESTLALGTPDRELHEIVELLPSVVVGPVEVLERASQPSYIPRIDASSRVAQWVRVVSLVAPRLKRTRRPGEGAQPSWRSFTLEGSCWPVTLPVAQR